MKNSTKELDQVFDARACANRLGISVRAFNKLCRDGFIISTAPKLCDVAAPPTTLWYWRDVAAYLRNNPVLPMAGASDVSPEPPAYV